MIIKNRRKAVHFRFNLIEIALALVILAIGLSSVMVLFPVGLNASKSSIADNNLGDVAERVAAYVQAKYTSSGKWGGSGAFADENAIKTFDPEGTSSPTADKFGTSEADGMDGLFEYTDTTGTYYLYRQYSNASKGNGGNNGNADRAVDFEAMVRVGWDAATLGNQYYLDLDTSNPAQFKSYSRATSSDATLNGSPMAGKTGSAILGMCCRTLIIEISWPADVDWANREKRIFRVEIYNENFVPYPQTGGGGSGGGGGS